LDKRAEIIGFISIKGGVGKTTVASNIAYILAHNLDKRTLIVDGNFSAPTLNECFNIVDAEAGLTDVLMGKEKLQRAIVEITPNLHVLPVNFYSGNIQYTQFRPYLCSLRTKYDYIIVDSSPALNEETLAAVTASDRLFIITTPDHVTLSATMKAIKIAKERKTAISGIIVNKLKGKKYEVGLGDIAEITGVPIVSSLFENDKVLKSWADNRVTTSKYPRSNISIESKKLAYALCGRSYKPYGVLSSVGSLFSNKISQEEINRTLLNSNFY
jgi:MinD-like ATPase involved in chromosome partitioning or flagellar assembly